MSRVRYEFHLKGLPATEGKIPARALIELLESLTECAERGLRLAIEGISVKSGPVPGWLARAVDLTFAGMLPGSSTILVEAPTLGEVFGDELRQQDLFITPPSPDDTALSLVSRSIRDTTAEQLESDYFDGGVLRSLLGFRSLFRTCACSVEWRVPERSGEELTFGMPDLEKVERLRERTPPSRMFVISGVLESIRLRERRFQLELPEGHSLACRIHEDSFAPDKLRALWGRKVTAEGMLHFKPSGRVQMLDAHGLAQRNESDEVFYQRALPDSTGDLFNVMSSGDADAYASAHAV